MGVRFQLCKGMGVVDVAAFRRLGNRLVWTSSERWAVKHTIGHYH